MIVVMIITIAVSVPDPYVNQLGQCLVLYIQVSSCKLNFRGVLADAIGSAVVCVASKLHGA